MKSFTGSNFGQVDGDGDGDGKSLTLVDHIQSQ